MGFLIQFVLFLIIIIAILYLTFWKVLFKATKLFFDRIKIIKDEMGKDE